MKKNHDGKPGFTLIELMIVVAVIGILAAIAIPNFMKFLAKTKQSEARTNLGAIYNCQLAYFGEKQTFADGAGAFNLIGFDPKSPVIMRYAFIMCDAEIKGAMSPDTLPSGPSCTEFGFTAYAAGNIDGDLTLDIWTINDKKTLINNSNDVMQ